MSGRSFWAARERLASDYRKVRTTGLATAIGGSSGVMSSGQIGWYLRRLARMSAPEIAHRVIEQARRTADVRSQRRWSDFGHFGGEFRGLPGSVASRVETLRPHIEGEVARLRERDFRLLNQQWPPTRCWDEVWQLDPVTLTQWPGAGTFAFHSAYRHRPDKGDVKFVWEINRLQFLPVLALANELDLLDHVLQSWMANNPPFQGINWSSGIEAASRVMSLLAALAFIGPEVCDGLRSRMRCFLDAHLFWIHRYPSLHSSANNHRVAELAAQFLGALCAPGLTDSAALLISARNGLEDRMQQIFHVDGVGAEQSVAYATYALEWLALAGIAGDSMGVGFSAAYKARAAGAADHLRWLMDDLACTPAIGDGDETRVLALKREPEKRYAASVVSLVARWLGRAELLPPATDVHIRDLWGVADLESAQPAPLGMRVFSEGGYTAFRRSTPCGTLVCVLDHGPLGFESIAAHGHADALSVWISWGDEPIFVDAGTYLYHSGGKWRDHFRATHVHNTLSIENADQSTIAGPFNWSRRAQARIVERSASAIAAEHDGYLGAFGVVHGRAVTMESSGQFVVGDMLTGSPRRSGLKWKVGYMLAPGLRVESADRAAVVTTAKGRALRLAVEHGPAPQHDSGSSYSPTFGRMAETGRLTFCGNIPNDSRCVLRLRFEPLIDG